MRFLPTVQKTGAFLFVLPALSLLAATVVSVPPLPEPLWEGREVSASVCLTNPAPAAGAEWRMLRVVLTCPATPSNNFEVALSRETDGLFRPDMVLGWDCGAWFLRPSGLRERRVSVPPDAAAPRARTLAAEFRVTKDGRPLGASFFRDGAAFSFSGLSLDPPPAWLVPASWERLTATARGAGTESLSVSTVRLADGLKVIFR